MAEISEFLRKRAEEGLLRELRPAAMRKAGRIYFGGKEYVDLSSNDYLGLSGHPQLAAAAKDAVDRYGTSSSASRLLSGDLELAHLLEEEVARFKNKESALVFNSGYQANVGIISALCCAGDAIFSDRLNHASIVDGILLSGSRLFRFRHNDLEHLGHMLERERCKFKNALIITESVFSMDGDKAPLRGLVELKKRYGCLLMVDEAHATGIFGKNGSGLAEEDGLSNEIEVIMGTFGKALGGFGAYLAASKETVDYLINTCRSFIYSTALPPAVLACDLAAIELVRNEPHRRRILLETAGYFRKALDGRGVVVTGDSQITPLIVGDSARASDMAGKLREKGFWILPVRPPTVPPGTARLRISLCFGHEKEVLDRLIDAIGSMRFYIAR